MVVLDGSGMFSSSGNQYIQPDYFHGPPSLDSKKSPLALLAQTCSQIGADTSSKPIIPAAEKIKSESEKPKPKSPLTSQEPKLAFKPYEIGKKDDPVEGKKTPTVKSVSPALSSRSTPSDNKTTSANSNSVSSESSAKSSDAATVTTSSVTTPIVRSGLEMLQGHPKDLPLGTYRPRLFPPGPGSLGDNPLLRPLPGPLYPPSLSADALHSNLSPYVSYTRVKTATGVETLVPVCRDPYCTGCPLSMHHAQLLGSGACPAGCAQCDHQKALSGLGLSSASRLPPVTAAQSAYNSVLNAHRPYVCNWIAGESYCGKRFTTSEELLQHLRTHTNLSASDSSALSLLNPALAAHSPLLTSPAGLHRTYPSLSPLTDLRYHPYAKPGLGAGLSTSPIPSIPPVHPSIGAYYSPYALYGQRLSAAIP